MAQGNLQESYVLAMQTVDTIAAKYGLRADVPSILYHYTSISIGMDICKSELVRLCHCEYSNDSDEIKHSIRMIDHKLNELINSGHTYEDEKAFYKEVLRIFHNRAQSYEAFVFCMSEGDTTKLKDWQDVLSMWRAYGKSVRGVSLSLSSDQLDITGTQDSYRLSRVVYDKKFQDNIIEDIIDRSWRGSATTPNKNSAVIAAAVALVFIMPIMKNEHFSEEKEWRFIYVPEPEESGQSKRKFYVNNYDLIVPYYEASKENNIDIVINEIMVGPSPWQEMNLRSLRSALHRKHISNSRIPYRS